MTRQILVVDDEPDMKALVLQKFRHQILDRAVNFLFASDGVEALAMPEVSGDICSRSSAKARKRLNDGTCGTKIYWIDTGSISHSGNAI